MPTNPAGVIPAEPPVLGSSFVVLEFFDFDDDCDPDVEAPEFWGVLALELFDAADTRPTRQSSTSPEATRPLGLSTPTRSYDNRRRMYVFVEIEPTNDSGQTKTADVLFEATSTH
jgi:hypothetical protein